MSRPNRPAASREMCKPIPDEIVSKAGVKFRPNEPSPIQPSVPDLRDTRDPEELGKLLLERGKGIAITDQADYLDSPSGRMEFEKQAVRRNGQVK